MYFAPKSFYECFYGNVWLYVLYSWWGSYTSYQLFWDDFVYSLLDVRYAYVSGW